MRQELLTKPEQQKPATKGKKQEWTPTPTTECTWKEPFVLYYDQNCMDDDVSRPSLGEESPLKFTIQMGYDDINHKKRGEVQIIEHLVGEQESFQLDQFSEGEIYLKEIRFGSKQSKNAILGFETPSDEEQEFGGVLLCKIQLLRDEEEILEEIMGNCS